MARGWRCAVGGFLANQRDINTVIYLFSKLLNVRGTVRPTTTDNLHLRATHLNGMRTLGTSYSCSSAHS